MVATGRTAPRQAAARAGAVLALAAALAGCAGDAVRRIPRPAHPSFGSAPAPARSEREAEMNRQWQNRRLAELVDAWGRPRMVMNIPGGGMPPSFAVVYGPDPASGCIDAFAVSSVGEPVVRIYHCR